MNDNEGLMDQLIQEVRTYPALYDTNHMDYMNIKVKLNIWNDIAAKSGFNSGIIAKNAWLKLRNCHRDAIRRQRRMRRRLGPSCPAVKDWKYQKQMEFLMPYMFSRRSLTKHDSDPLKEDELLNGEDGFEHGNGRSFKSEMNYQDDDDANDDSEYIDAGGFLNLQHENNEDVKTSDKSCKNDDSELNQDPLYHFFMSMYASTKRMPPQSQHKVRLQVFTTVSNAEAELFNITPYNNE